MTSPYFGAGFVKISTGFQDAEMIPAMIVLMGNSSACATCMTLP
jgi:hypothetical protein